jgi:hypothetical protein
MSGRLGGVTTNLKVCTPKSLPHDKWVEAAENAARLDPRNLPEGVRPHDALLAGDRLAVDVQRYPAGEPWAVRRHAQNPFAGASFFIDPDFVKKVDAAAAAAPPTPRC